MTRPVVLAAISDVHAGSTIAMCPPQGVRHDDGGRYQPSVLNLWLWERWGRYWDEVERIRQQNEATLGILCNGDACDGPGHHDTHQSIGRTAEEQTYIVGEVFGVPKRLSPDWWVFTKGTPVHVGPGADSESALARSLGAEKHPVTDSWTWYAWEAEIHGVRINATHHGRSGGRPWTMASAAGILASEILMEYVQAGRAYPHLAIRSHKHKSFDSGTMHPVRVVGLPAWQSMSEYGWKVVPEKAVGTTFGGCIVVIQPNETYDLRTILYRPDPLEPWRPPATD